jgi:hypothetical protein
MGCNVIHTKKHSCINASNRIELDCPVCHKGKIKAHNTDLGAPKIKLPLDFGDGTPATTEIALLWRDV